MGAAGREAGAWRGPAGVRGPGDRRGDRRQVTAGPVLDCWQYHIRVGRDVVIVTYGCDVASTAPPQISSEHKGAGLFTLAEVPGLAMPAGYKRSIADWFARLAAATAAVGSHPGPESLMPGSGIPARPASSAASLPAAFRVVGHLADHGFVPGDRCVRECPV